MGKHWKFVQIYDNFTENTSKTFNIVRHNEIQYVLNFDKFQQTETALNWHILGLSVIF